MVVSLAVAAPAGAQEEPPSSVFQYVELIPEAGGPVAPGLVDEQEVPLPPDAVEALERAPESVAAPLEEVATSTRYGAPADSRPRVVGEQVEPPAAESIPVSLGSTVRAVSSTEDRQLLGMLVALLLVTAGAVALAVRGARA